MTKPIEINNTTKPTEINNTFILVVTTCTTAFITFVTAIAVTVVICIVLKKKDKRINEQEDVPVYESIPLPPNVALYETSKYDWNSTKVQESDENYYDEIKIIRESITQFELKDNYAYL